MLTWLMYIQLMKNTPFGQDYPHLSFQFLYGILITSNYKLVDSIRPSH